MIISIINGSPRTQGATGTILQEMKKYLEKKDDIIINYVNVAQLNMKFCRGCISCYKTGTCIITDDVEVISGKIKESDGIIIGSPTYGSNISGYLKNFIDRGHFIVEQSLFKKYGFAVGTYEIADGTKVVKIIKKFFLVSGASRVGDILVKLDHNNNPLADSRFVKRIHKKMDIFYNAIQKQKKKSFYERLFNDFLIVRIIWKPIFIKQADKYAGILNLWKEKKIIESE